MTNGQLQESAKEEIKKLVIARFETLNPNSKIVLLGESRPLSVRDLLDEVRNGTPLGEKILKVQFGYLKMLTEAKI